MSSTAKMAEEPINVVTQKIPEKLMVMRNRGIGLITRIYNIKKIQADPTLKPSFMTMKHLEAPIKLLEKKFPECKDAKVIAAVSPIKQDITKALSSYYNTFVDVLYYRKTMQAVLNTIDSCNIFLDITTNFDLTKLYLDVVCIYIRLMVLMSRIEDRKTVLGLFNAAYNLTHGTSDSVFAELGAMVTCLQKCIYLCGYLSSYAIH